MISIITCLVLSLGSSLPAPDAKLAPELDSRGIQVYGQGQNAAINAPGVASSPAFKGFPSAGTGPRQTNFLAAKAYSWLNPGRVPEGVNPARCTPKQGQYPIILLPGTTETAYNNWAYLGPKLADQGFCVYSMNHNPPKILFGILKSKDLAFTGEISGSSKALDAFIDQVLALTGASKVDIVGHSQGGGAMPYYYLKNIMSKDNVNVRKMIGMAPGLGTTAHGIKTLVSIVVPGFIGSSINSVIDKLFNMGSLYQQLADSEFLTELRKGGYAVNGVEYVNIHTKDDDVQLPYSASIWYQDGYNVSNYILQDYCPNEHPTHLALSYSSVSYQLILNSLLDRDNAIQCPSS